MITKHPVNTTFAYWTLPEPPDPANVVDLINGVHPGMQNHSTEVQDIRDSATELKISKHALQVVRHQSALLPPNQNDFDWTDVQQLRDHYWPELRAVLKSELGARSVMCLENTTRTSTENAHVDIRDKDFRMPMVNGKRAPKPTGQPFHIVHNDYSPVGSRNVIRAIKPTFFEDNDCTKSVTADEQAEFFKLRSEIVDAEKKAMMQAGCADYTQWDGTDYEGPRWAFLSIWRPLVPVEKDPIAVLDPSSLFPAPNDYTERLKSYVSIPFPHRDRRGLEDYTGANMMPGPPTAENPHRWLWMSNQKPDEILAFKFFDSEADKKGSGVMPGAGHSAFRLPDQDDKPPRRSIETRTLVIW